MVYGSVALDVLSARDDINYGSIYESVVAQELFAQGFVPHYYANKRRGEVDFVVEDTRSGAVIPVEVKSGKGYKRHNALDNLLADGLAQRAVVLSNANVEKRGDKLYLPVYAASYVLQV